MLQEEIFPINQVEFLRCAGHTALQADGFESYPQQDGDENQHDQAWKKDRAIEEKINHALWKNDVLRATDFNEVDIRVKNGIVYISGHLISGTNQDRIEKALKTVEGIEAIRSALVMDDDLLRDVAVSFTELEQTHHCKFFTGVSHGVIVLNGEVSSRELRKSAEICASSQPGVRGVINYLRVPGVIIAAEDRRFLQPAIGEEICFLDGISGSVRQVVINPDNRRVMAMTIQGRFFASKNDRNESNIYSVQPPEQLLLIPMSIVGVLTDSSGFLTTDSTDFEKYRIFNAAEFMTPGPVMELGLPPRDWIPPYPYCPADVLFPRDPALFAQWGTDNKDQ